MPSFISRFSAAHQAAARGELDHWTHDAEGTLALLVLLDQLPRNTWRNNPHMVATDGLALAVAHEGGRCRFRPARRMKNCARFFYLPFMHSEVLDEQERSVALNAALDDNTQRFAVLHRDIIARFGRFPASQPDARAHLQRPKSRRFSTKGGFAG
jgi:uncharacterized protein (DUF924 family)